MALVEFDWLCAATAAIVYYVLGGLWFTPLFGRAWDRSIGHDRSTDDGRFPASYYVVPLVGAVISTGVVACLVAVIDPGGVAASMAVGAGVGVAVAAASTTNALTPHTPKPYQFAAVTGGYHLVACTLAGLVIGLV